ncbi:hypothetical protein [Beduinella massiliensis]|uniref:hypothetical protein n=1 Tax=Beduinella massiliensis TaxID=1852363 RepID=UPI000C81E4B8
MYVFLSLLALVVGVALAALGGRTAKIPRKPGLCLAALGVLLSLTGAVFLGLLLTGRITLPL